MLCISIGIESRSPLSSGHRIPSGFIDGLRRVWHHRPVVDVRHHRRADRSFGRLYHRPGGLRGREPVSPLGHRPRDRSTIGVAGLPLATSRSSRGAFQAPLDHRDHRNPRAFPRRRANPPWGLFDRPVPALVRRHRPEDGGGNTDSPDRLHRSAVVAALILKRTIFGRWVYAIRTMRTRSSQASPSKRVKFLLFAVSAPVGVRGLMMVSRCRSRVSNGLTGVGRRHHCAPGRSRYHRRQRECRGHVHRVPGHRHPPHGHDGGECH